MERGESKQCGEKSEARVRVMGQGHTYKFVSNLRIIGSERDQREVGGVVN